MKTLLFASLIFVASSLVAGQTIYDKTTKLIWQDSKDNKKLSLTYAKAQNYCSKLVIDKHTNFRIPTMDELQSIIDYKNYDPAIVKGFEYVSNEAYWTTTPFADDDKVVWLIHFKKGERYVKDKHYDRYIRCVQSSK